MCVSTMIVRCVRCFALLNNICICSYASVVDGSGPGQGTSAEYEIFDKRRMSPPGNLTKRNDLEEDRRDDGETN